jgi:hypothetical protein
MTRFNIVGTSTRAGPRHARPCSLPFLRNGHLSFKSVTSIRDVAWGAHMFCRPQHPWNWGKGTGELGRPRLWISAHPQRFQRCQHLQMSRLGGVRGVRLSTLVVRFYTPRNHTTGQSKPQRERSTRSMSSMNEAAHLPFTIMYACMR